MVYCVHRDTPHASLHLVFIPLGLGLQFSIDPLVVLFIVDVTAQAQVNILPIKFFLLPRLVKRPHNLCLVR
jgi:hypothetical protein